MNVRKVFDPNATVNYYLKHPRDYFRYLSNIKELKSKKDFNTDPNFQPEIQSSLEIDVVIPAIEKDFITLEYVLDSIRTYIKHPIGSIFIISPKSQSALDLCKRKSCIFIDEDTVLPIKIKDIHYKVDGKDRSGWIYQQLLKWNANTISSKRYFLITESDTIFIRPRVFEYNNKVLLPCADDYCHYPYFTTYKKLLGEDIRPLYNVTSHHSLFDTNKLSDLKNRIEKHCSLPWYQAIINILDPQEFSCVSDYETYGQFILAHYPDEVQLEFWFNKSLKVGQLKEIEELENRYKDEYKALSFHSYNI